MQKIRFSTWGFLALLLFGLPACKAIHLINLEQTNRLKQTGIVFRLQDYKQRVDFYEKNGMAERAKTERAAIEAYNRQLIKDFKENFDFCKIQFFYASQIKDLRAGKPVLLNERMEPDPSIPLPPIMMIAGYGVEDVENHAFSQDLFRIEQTGINISPTFKTKRRGDKLQARDVRKINKKLKGWNTD